MPELPGRPDADQLRRQARELLRAAADHEPSAVARLSAVSQRVTLSAAQLAVAREYGFASWPALRAEAERRRRLAEPPDAFEDRWSFAGAGTVQTSAGLLHPTGLMAGPRRAHLDLELTPADEIRSQFTAPPLTPSARGAGNAAMAASVRAVIDEVTFIDGQGTCGRLRSMPGSGMSRAHDASLISMGLWLDPVPARQCGWIELRGRDGSKTRLTRSARPAVRMSEMVPVPGSPAERELSDQALEVTRVLYSGDGQRTLEQACLRALAKAAELRQSGQLPAASEISGQLAQLCAALTGQQPLAEIPRRWSSLAGARGRSDGAAHHLDIATDLPRIGDVEVRVDGLISEPESWGLFLRAKPGWWRYSEDGKQKWSVISVDAEDDRGGRYLTTFGGSAADSVSEELALRLLPRLDPLARALTLTFTAGGEQVTLEILL